MSITSFEKKRHPRAALALFLTALMSLPTPASSLDRDNDGGDHKTATPIKHVIVIIGENRTFDNIYATYVPKQARVQTSSPRESSIRTARPARTQIWRSSSNSRPSTRRATSLTRAS